MDKEEAWIQNIEYALSGLAKDNWRDFLKDEDVQYIARNALEIIKLLHEKHPSPCGQGGEEQEGE